MQVKSVFEFKFPSEAQQEGLTICSNVGRDMVPLKGYLGHEVLQDVKDPGHLMVNTLWESEEASVAVLSKYVKDEKISRATKLIGSEPTGFTGNVLPANS